MGVFWEDFLNEEIERQVLKAFRKLNFQQMVTEEIKKQSIIAIEKYLQDPEITKLIMALIQNETAKARPPEPLPVVEVWQISNVLNTDYYTKQLIQKQVDERINDWLSMPPIKPPERIIPY